MKNKEKGEKAGCRMKRKGKDGILEEWNSGKVGKWKVFLMPISQNPTVPIFLKTDGTKEYQSGI